MSDVDLVVLGTSSAAPTRHRNHNGYLLRLGPHHVLFDPGEGTQRQYTLAGVSAARTDVVAITHFHGDHCLGLPGMLSRLDHERDGRDVRVVFPGDDVEQFTRLREAAHAARRGVAHPVPVDVAAAAVGLVEVGDVGRWTLQAASLDHRVSCVGYRLTEPAGTRFTVDALAHHGIAGAAVGALERTGIHVRDDGLTVGIEEVSEVRPGMAIAFIMDTRLCANVASLAADADLVIIESTFEDDDAALAEEYGHLTAGQAGDVIAAAGARLAVLTHFSSRYPGTRILREQAAARAPSAEILVADDLDVIPVPRP